MNSLANFMKDEEGLTAVEYVIAASLMVAGLTALFSVYGLTLEAALGRVLDRIV